VTRYKGARNPVVAHRSRCVIAFLNNVFIHQLELGSLSFQFP
jgi:hypothetical protein